MGSSTKRQKSYKEPKRNFGTKEYNDGTEEFHREFQQQTWPIRRKNE